MSTIRVITEPATTQQEGTLGMLEDGAQAIRDFDVAQLGESLACLSEQMSEMLQNVKQVGGFQLKEVRVAVEISSEGGVALIGSVKAGARGGLTLTFSA